MKTTFYDKHGLKGNSHQFSFGFYNQASFTTFLSILLSVSVPSGTKLTLYNSDNFNGQKHIINNMGKKPLKIPNLSTIFSFPVISFKVECSSQDFNNNVVNYEKIVDFFSREEDKLIAYTYYKVHPLILLEEPPKSNPLVIIIPDFLHSNTLYDEMQKQFAQNKISSLVLDLRGVGASYSSDNITYSDLIQDYRVLINDLGLFDKKPILIGHGFGGAMAQLWTITYPTELSRLILISSAPFPIYSTYNMINSDINDWVSSSITLNDLETTILNATYETEQGCLRFELETSIQSIDESTQKLFITLNGDNVSLLPTFQNHYMSTLLIHGLDDQYIPVNGSDDLFILMNNDDNVIYIKYATGHAPHLERTLDIMCAIIEYINPQGLEYFDQSPQ